MPIVFVFEDENCNLLTWYELENNEQLLSELKSMKIPEETMVAKFGINDQCYCFVSITMKKDLLIQLEAKGLIGDPQLFNGTDNLMQTLESCLLQQMGQQKQI